MLWNLIFKLHTYSEPKQQQQPPNLFWAKLEIIYHMKCYKLETKLTNQTNKDTRTK